MWWVGIWIEVEMQETAFLQTTFAQIMIIHDHHWGRLLILLDVVVGTISWSDIQWSCPCPLPNGETEYYLNDINKSLDMIRLAFNKNYHL